MQNKAEYARSLRLDPAISWPCPQVRIDWVQKLRLVMFGPWLPWNLLVSKCWHPVHVLLCKILASCKTVGIPNTHQIALIKSMNSDSLSKYSTSRYLGFPILSSIMLSKRLKRFNGLGHYPSLFSNWNDFKRDSHVNKIVKHFLSYVPRRYSRAEHDVLVQNTNAPCKVVVTFIVKVRSVLFLYGRKEGENVWNP